MRKSHLFGLLPLYVSSFLLMACSSQEQVTEPQVQHEANTNEITLSVHAPNDIVLRSTNEATDPLTSVQTLRFVFYRKDEQTHRVAHVREVTAKTNDLNNIRVKLPKGEYELIAIANPTSKLIELTRENSSIELLTKGSRQTAADLRIASFPKTSKLLIAMLNAQGSVSVTPNAFDTSADPIAIELEPALARVLVFGSPEVIRGTKGTAPIRYTIVNLTRDMSYLRMLNRLESGQEEQPADRSKRTNRYAKCNNWDSWAEHPPTSTEGIATLTASLYKREEYWTKAQARAEDFATLLNTPSLYCKEGVIPPNAYLQGLVPTAVIAFPYIPEGLTLNQEEGWVEYQGRVYTETRVKEMIQTNTFDTPGLEAAIKKAGITTNSFTEAFTKEGINFYYKSINYYSVPIRHFASATEPTSYGRYGVVRGNEYHIRLIRVAQMGASTPTLYDGNLQPIQESKPLSHSLSVIPVETRIQEAEL